MTIDAACDLCAGLFTCLPEKHGLTNRCTRCFDCLGEYGVPLAMSWVWDHFPMDLLLRAGFFDEEDLPDDD